MMEEEINPIGWLFQQEWFVEDWIFSVIDLMNLPFDKERIKKLSMEAKIEIMDAMGAALPDPEE